MPFASPADRSPIPQVEAPRDCPLCPRLVRFREECRAEFPNWWTRRSRCSATPKAWLAIVGLAPGKQGANRTGRPFTGDFAGELLYATLLKFGLAERRVSRGSRRWAAAERRHHPQRRQTPASGEQAEPGEIATCRNYFEAASRGPAKGAGGRRARPDRTCSGGAGAGRAPVVFGHGSRDCGARRPGASVELSLLAVQPEHAQVGRRDVRERLRAGT